MIRWHGTTCKTCTHYLWNSPGTSTAGYGCAVLADLSFPNAGDTPCPHFLDYHCKAQWSTRSSAGKNLERLMDYASDQRLEDEANPEEFIEWAASICEVCGEHLHECRCDSRGLAKS